MKSFIVGITGGFGVGKSAVCSFLQELGAAWIEADEIVHKLYKPGGLGYKKVAGYFGEKFVDVKKGVRMEKLRSVVLKNPQKLWILQKLIHPIITHEAQNRITRSKQKIICLESIYFEKDDLGKLVDMIVEIQRKPEFICKSRAQEKRWNLEDINRFMKLSPIFPKPDRIIENNQTLRRLKQKAGKLWQELQ